MGLPEEIAGWICSQVRRASAQGLVLGLSGGLDSAVVAVLSKRAVQENMLGLIMPCETAPEHLELAWFAASELGIPSKEISLDEIHQKLVGLLPAGSHLARANLKARLRMTTLYYFANSLNYLVVGTGNKSEISVGYFTKYGDGGVDILPLGDLLKTEVRELARQLDIPERILEQPPSAGLWQGQTDEAEIGLSYADLDNALSAIADGSTDAVPEAVLSRVETMMRVSRHKRALPPVFRQQHS